MVKTTRAAGPAWSFVSLPSRTWCFYFAPSFYLPFDLGELFVLGYVLVIADSGLVVFLGIKLFGPVLSSNKTK